MKCLVFDVFGDFAHFKRIYTTTSSYTYSVPPKTTVVGLIGAILGYSKDEYYDLFNIIKISISVKCDIKTQIIKQNYLKTDGDYNFKKGSIKNRTQIPIEFVKNPKYRIFVIVEDQNIYEKLKEMLKNKKTYYTVYLGITECIADYEFIGEFEVNQTENNYCDSIVPEEFFNSVKIDENYDIHIESVPIEIDKNRTTKSIKKFLISKKTEFKENIDLYKVGDEFVIFF